MAALSLIVIVACIELVNSRSTPYNKGAFTTAMSRQGFPGGMPPGMSGFPGMPPGMAGFSGMPPGPGMSGGPGVPPEGFPEGDLPPNPGFEGYLAPNTWYGMAPWGAEGVIFVIPLVIIAMVFCIVFLGFLAWLGTLLFGTTDFARSYIPNWSWNIDTIADLTTSILDAIDKYEELQKGNAINER